MVFWSGKRHIMDRMDPVLTPSPLYQSGSFNGHHAALVAGLEALKLYDRQTVAATCARGAKLAGLLRHTCQKLGLNIQIQNEGALLYLHFTHNPIRSAADVASGYGVLSELLYRELLLRGILTTARQMSFISTTHSDEHLERYNQAFEASLRSLLPVIEKIDQRLLF